MPSWVAPAFGSIKRLKQMKLEIKTWGDNSLDLGYFDECNGEVQITLTDSEDQAITWIKKEHAIQIINHLKEQFGI